MWHNMFKGFVLTGLFLFLAIGFSYAQFGGGDGSENNPYLVETAAHLNLVRNYPTSHFRQIADIDLTPYAQGAGWEPINNFSGLYNGNQYTIYNLRINRPSTDYVGLFAAANSASFHHIFLDDVHINGRDYVGGLVGSATQSTLYQCSITEGVIRGNDYTGGLVGFGSTLWLGMNSALINIQSRDYAGGIIGVNHLGLIESNTSEGVVEGRDNVGGLIGYSILHPDLEIPSIYSCRSSVEVTGRDRVGGLVGYNIGNSNKPDTPTISSSSSSSSVEGENYVGGLVGYNYYYSMIDSSYSTGIVLGDSNVGGLVGTSTYDSSIEYCYSSSDVYSNLSNVGGLVGTLTESTNVYYNNRVYRSYSTGKVTGIARTGGLVGYSTKSSVLQSYSTSSAIGEEDVGGLVGSLDNTILISNYATGVVSGEMSIGGLVGWFGSNSELYTSYSTGLVSSIGQALNVGGFIGTNHGDIEYCYWDIVTSKQTSSAGEPDVEGKMTVDLLRTNTNLYSNWDFQDTWRMTDYTTYPFFQWQGDRGDIHNYPPNGYFKEFRNRTWYWESFPLLWNRDNNGYQSAQELLDPLRLGGGLEQIQDVLDRIISVSWGQWQGNDYGIHSTDGYQLKFVDTNLYELLVDNSPGFPSGEPFESDMTIREHAYESWLGYFIPQTQPAMEAFSEVIDDLKEIQSEEWGMYRTGPGPNDWIFDGVQDPKVVFGKMYRVIPSGHISTPITDFNWNIPEERDYWEPRPKAEYFVYNEKPRFESFFIEEIEDDEDILEVAVYADEECVGAALFHDNYPLEIQAYTDESHFEAEITFAVLRSGERGAAEKFRAFEVRDTATGEYRSGRIEPYRERFTIVRLGSGEYEPLPVIKPEITLAQNYPNPFVLTSAKRSRLTEIPFYVSEEREVVFNIYNIRGQLVKNLHRGKVNAGKHSISWNGLNEQNRRVGSGVYFYRLESGDTVITRKMLIIR